MDDTENNFKARIMRDLLSIKSAHNSPPSETKAVDETASLSSTYDDFHHTSGSCEASCHWYKIVFFTHDDSPRGLSIIAEGPSSVDKKPVDALLATVTLDADAWPFCVKIQITSDFPVEAPLVLVRRKRDSARNQRKERTQESRYEGGETTTPAEIVEMATRLAQQIKDATTEEDRREREERFFTDVFSFVRSRLDPDLVEEPDLDEERPSPSQRKSGSGRGRACRETEEEMKWRKKPPMKTSADVIKRFLWDEAVPLSRVKILSFCNHIKDEDDESLPDLKKMVKL